MVSRRAVAGLITAMCVAAGAARGQSADPGGLQVYNQSTMRIAFDTDPQKPVKLDAIRMVGARNGVFTGKVVIVSKGAITGLHATASDLVHTGGKGTIPAAGIELYNGLITRFGKHIVTFDQLAPPPFGKVPVFEPRSFRRHWVTSTAVMNHAVATVWIAVNVPDGAAPGEYEGVLKVSAGGRGPAKVPVKLYVSGYRIPDPAERQTFFELVQSPDSVALYYQVPLWSDRHWKLMEKSFEQIAKVGHKTLYIPLICETNLGNAESMVRWIKKNGQYEYDLSILEKYLDMALAAGINPQFVSLWVWDAYLDGGAVRRGYLDDSWHTSKDDDPGPKVTVVDGTGKVETVVLPKHADAARSLALWKPLIVKVKALLKARGIEKKIIWGMTSDKVPTVETVNLFRSIDPAIKWSRRGHGRFKDIHGVPYALQISPSGSSRYTYHLDPGQFTYGWQRVDPCVEIGFCRAARNYFARCRYRMMAEANIGGTQAGHGGWGGDTWPSLRDKRGRVRGRVTEGRYPASSWRNISIVTNLLHPGPEGALPTARFLLVREGLQECEARIAIEKAMIAGKVSGALAGACKKLIDDRNQKLKAEMPGNWHYGESHYENAKKEYPAFIDGPWQERSKTLFDAAYKVAMIADPASQKAKAPRSAAPTAKPSRKAPPRRKPAPRPAAKPRSDSQKYASWMRMAKSAKSAGADALAKKYLERIVKQAPAGSDIANEAREMLGEL